MKDCAELLRQALLRDEYLKIDELRQLDQRKRVLRLRRELHITRRKDDIVIVLQGQV